MQTKFVKLGNLFQRTGSKERAVFSFAFIKIFVKQLRSQKSGVDRYHRLFTYWCGVCIVHTHK